MSWAVTVFERDRVLTVTGTVEHEVGDYFSRPNAFRANRPFKIDVYNKWSVPAWHMFLAWVTLYPTITTVQISSDVNDTNPIGLVLRAIPTLRSLWFSMWYVTERVTADVVDALARHPCLESFVCPSFDVTDLAPAVLANASISSIHASCRNTDAALHTLRDVRTLRSLTISGGLSGGYAAARRMPRSIATVVVDGVVVRDDPLANARHEAARKILVLCAHPALYDDGDHAIKRSIRDCMVAIGAPAGEIDDSDDDTVVLEDVVVIDDDDVL